MFTIATTLSRNLLNATWAIISREASTMSEDPFAIVASSGAVDPGLLFTFPDTRSSTRTTEELSAPTIAYSQPPATQIVRQPYQHQQRESRRDQEELRLVRSSGESNNRARYDKASFSSPARNSHRPGILRRDSDSRTKAATSRGFGQLLKIAPKPLTTEHSVSLSKRRRSPLKHQSRTSLNSIPESVREGALL